MWLFEAIPYSFVCFEKTANGITNINNSVEEIHRIAQYPAFIGWSWPHAQSHPSS